MRKALRTIVIGMGLGAGRRVGPPWRRSRRRRPARGLGRLTPAEQWVLQQVAAGGGGGLKGALRGRGRRPQPPGPVCGGPAHRGLSRVQGASQRHLSAQRRHSRHREPAIRRRWSQAVFLVGCQFQGLVNCSGSHFKKTLGMKQAVFAQQANFHQLKVDLDAFFGEAEFKGPVDFGAAQIEGNLVLKGPGSRRKTRKPILTGSRWEGACTARTPSLRAAWT